MTEDLDRLNDEDRARVISVTRLLKHLKSFEDTGLLSEYKASELIGAVKILNAIATNNFIPKHRN